MTAERKPSESSSLVAPLRLVTRLVLRYPVPTVSLAVALAVVSIAMAATQLRLRTSRLDLLNPESPYNKRWLEYIQDFGDRDDVVVVVEGSQPEAVVDALEEIASRLSEREDIFHAVLHRFELSKIRAKALFYLNTGELEEVDAFLNRVESVLQGDWSQLSFVNRVGQLAVQATDPASRARVESEISRLSESLFAMLEHPNRYVSPWPELPFKALGANHQLPEYLLANEGRFGFVLLRLPDERHASIDISTVIAQLRKVLDRIDQDRPEVTIGLTGLPIMEHDEMLSSRRGTLRASLYSLIGVVGIFVAGFGGLRHPLMTLITLILALAWSLGYVTLAVGHLNILSMAFGVILIGLGVDFTIHYFARYLYLRRSIDSSEEALHQTVASVGPGIVIGGLTTSIAFFTAGLTDFTGVAELGVIVGGGILLCLVSTIVVLPALVQLSEQRPGTRSIPVPLALGHWVSPLHSFPRTTLLLSLIVSGLLVVGLPRLRYDHNLLNLQPIGLESVELERRLMAESDQSLWFALSIADSREQLLDRKRKFLGLESVERTEEIASLLLTDVSEKRQRIERIHNRFTFLPDQPPQLPIGTRSDLHLALDQLKTLAINPNFHEQTRRQVTYLHDHITSKSRAQFYRDLSHYQRRVAQDLLQRLNILRNVSDPSPPQLEDLPENVVTRFVGQSGRNLLKVYSRANIWDMDALEQFVHDVRRVDPEATGKPLQTYEASRHFQRSYFQAALYSLLAVSAVLFVDFGSIRMVMLVLLPVGLGMLQMLGLLGLLDIPLNPANMIVLPLILGIGIDDGVHVMHDFRWQQGRYKLGGSTATAVLITSLTSMVGFGSLMVASHRGLESLGRVLIIGVSCCLMTSLLTLPALLSWLSRFPGGIIVWQKTTSAAAAQSNRQREEVPIS